MIWDIFSSHNHNIPQEGKFHTLPAFGGLTYFEISHHLRCRDLFTRIERKGEYYNRIRPSHPVIDETKELYQAALPRRSAWDRTVHSKAGKPPTVIETTKYASQ